MTRFGTAEDYEFWAREALPVSIDRVIVLAPHPHAGEVTLMIKWARQVNGPRNRERSARIVREYVQEHAPVNTVVHVRGIE